MTRENTKLSYWFKRKGYGFGWVPTSWQGFIVIFLYLMIIFAASLMWSVESQRNAILYTAFIAMTTILLVVVTRRRVPTDSGFNDDTENDS